MTAKNEKHSKLTIKDCDNAPCTLHPTGPGCPSWPLWGWYTADYHRNQWESRGSALSYTPPAPI